MNTKLMSAFDKHAAATFDKQLYLADLVGELDWKFDMQTGVLGFGLAHGWSAQVLGTQSDHSGTWLWAWANDASGIPENLLTCARSLRQLGANHDIPELVQAELSIDQTDGHFWSILATGLCKANAYFRGPYDGGAVYLLVKDAQYGYQVDDPLARLRSVFLQAISTYSIDNHRSALIGHAELLGLSTQPNGKAMTVADRQGNQLCAAFDGEKRLTRLSGKVS